MVTEKHERRNIDKYRTKERNKVIHCKYQQNKQSLAPRTKNKESPPKKKKKQGKKKEGEIHHRMRRTLESQL